MRAACGACRRWPPNPLTQRAARRAVANARSSSSHRLRNTEYSNTELVPSSSAVSQLLAASPVHPDDRLDARPVEPNDSPIRIRAKIGTVANSRRPSLQCVLNTKNSSGNY